jgi:putative transposase
VAAPTKDPAGLVLADGPVAWPKGWVRWVNAAFTEGELEAIRRSIGRGQPYGDEAWARKTAAQLGLESTLQPRGRPKKAEKGS